jgi:hypothetical protein
MDLNGTRFAAIEDIKSNATNSGRFQKKPSAGVFNNGRVDGACMCVLKVPILKAIM